jgi:putative protein kinase ArgK-like GTPase of G3E family
VASTAEGLQDELEDEEKEGISHIVQNIRRHKSESGDNKRRKAERRRSAKRSARTMLDADGSASSAASTKTFRNQLVS